MAAVPSGQWRLRHQTLPPRVLATCVSVKVRGDRKQKKRVAERKVKSHELGALADVASPSQRLSGDADDMDTQTDTYMDTPDRKQKKRVAGRKMRSLELGALADMTSRSHQRLSEDDDGMDTQADAHKDTPSRASQLTKILHS